MAGRSGDTFKKRQKEVARAEKHREKLARRMERKHHKQTSEQAIGEAPETGAGSEETEPMMEQPGSPRF